MAVTCIAPHLRHPGCLSLRGGPYVPPVPSGKLHGDPDVQLDTARVARSTIRGSAPQASDEIRRKWHVSGVTSTRITRSPCAAQLWPFSSSRRAFFRLPRRPWPTRRRPTSSRAGSSGGLTQPTDIGFSPDGRVFVAEKSGLLKVFDNLNDTSATVVADLRTNVHNFWDRGMLGMALDPQFPQRPYVYVLYTHDALIGGTAPRWGTPGATADPVPEPAGRNGQRLRRQRPPVPASAVGQHGGRRRAGADRRLVPAVPKPLRSAAWRSARTARST